MADKDKKIVVYSATNAHGYLMSVVHRLKYHKNDFAIYVGEKESALRCGGNDIFDRCILFNHIVGPWGRYNNLNANELENFILKYFDDEFDKIGINIKNASELYIGAYWSDFPIYVNIKGLKHYVFQEATGDMGMLSKYDNRFPAKSTLQEKYGILKRLENPKIIEAYASVETIKRFGEHPKIKIVDINDEILNLDEANKQKLRDSFNVPRNFTSSENDILVLTNWFTKDNATWCGKEPIKMYAILCDLYSGYKDTNSSIYLKCHPAEPNKDNYKEYLSVVEYFDYKLPSELLCIVKNIHFNAAITVASTSINSVKHFADNVYTLNGFHVLYARMFQVYFGMNICNRLKKYCYYFGVFDEIIKPLLRFNQDTLPQNAKWIEIYNTQIPENAIVIINDYLWREGQKVVDFKILDNLPESSAVFIITDDISRLIHGSEYISAIRNISGISLIIDTFRKKTAFNSEDKTLYLYCKNRYLRDKILSLDFFEVLQVSGITVEKQNFSDAENLQLQNNIYHDFICRNKIK